MPNNCQGSTRLSSYYAGAGIIPIGTVGYPYGTRTLIPVYGRLALSNFYGAAYDAGQVINGNFEIITGITEDATRYNLVGWTVYKQTTRMAGNAQILNCFTPNLTSSPTPAPTAPFTSPGDNVLYSTDISNNPSFSVRVLDTTNPLFSSLAVPGGTGQYVLELRNSGTFNGVVSPSNPNAFGIMRGPYMVSNNSFLFSTGDRLRFNWRAAKDPQGDVYAVFVYLLNTVTCEKIVLLDTYGTNSGWQLIDYTLTNSALSGQYKIVVVHGSYDSVGGMKVGAYLYLDNFELIKTTVGQGQTTTTTTSTSTTTQSYTYNGNETLSVTPGTFKSKRSVPGGEISTYEVSVLDNLTLSVTGAKPGNQAFLDTVSGYDQTGNLWLPGQSYSSLTAYNLISGSGMFTSQYTGLTTRIYDTQDANSINYIAVFSGLGVGGNRGIELQVTSPISVLAESAPSIDSLGYITGFSASTKVIFEGDQVTFTIRDSRDITSTLYWRLNLLAGWTGIANTENFFQGGVAGSYPLSGLVVLNNGIGQITVKTQEIATPHANRTLRLEIFSQANNGRRLAFVDNAFVDKNYQGQITFSTPGTHTWIVPTGVYSVDVVAVGGGGGGGYGVSSYNGSGGGGSLSYLNNLAVVPGASYTVIVGAGGTAGNTTTANSSQGGFSLFGLTSTIGTANVVAYGGKASNGYSSFGSLVGVGSTFYAGGTGSATGGAGGAGGYSGVGGNGSVTAAGNGVGGAGGGGSVPTTGNIAGDGGGVGLLGQGGNGVGAQANSADANGGAGSGGLNKLYGGGGGGARSPSTEGNIGGGGAVRIIWGQNRSFPTTNTGNMPTIT